MCRGTVGYWGCKDEWDRQLPCFCSNKQTDEQDALEPAVAMQERGRGWVRAHGTAWGRRALAQWRLEEGQETKLWTPMARGPVSNGRMQVVLTPTTHLKN